MVSWYIPFNPPFCLSARSSIFLVLIARLWTCSTSTNAWAHSLLKTKAVTNLFRSRLWYQMPSVQNKSAACYSYLQLFLRYLSQALKQPPMTGPHKATPATYHRGWSSRGNQLITILCYSDWQHWDLSSTRWLLAYHISDELVFTWTIYSLGQFISGSCVISIATIEESTKIIHPVKLHTFERAMHW